MNNQANLLLEQARRDPSLSPSERESLRAQAQEMRFQAGVGINRQYSSDVLGIAQGRAGVTGAQASVISSQASLFGTASDVQTGGLAQASAIAEQAKTLEDYLKRGNLSLAEQLRIQSQIVSLRREEVQTTEQAYRSAARQNIEVSGLRLGREQTSLGYQEMLGKGGPGLIPQQNAIIGAAATSAQQAQNYINLLRSRGVQDGNPELEQAKNQLQQAQVQKSQSVLGLADIPVPASLTQEQKRLQFQQDVMQRTYGSYGSLRENLQSQVRAAGQEMANVRSMMDKAEREGRFNGPEGEALRYKFEDRMMAAGEKAIGAQTQLESGQFDRLISSVTNGPSGLGMIASKYTRRESAGFLQAVSPIMGFTDSRARDYYENRGVKFANTLVGNFNRRDSFLDSALSGYQTDRRGNVSKDSSSGGAHDISAPPANKPISHIIPEAPDAPGQEPWGPVTHRMRKPVQPISGVAGDTGSYMTTDTSQEKKGEQHQITFLGGIGGPGDPSVNRGQDNSSSSNSGSGDESGDKSPQEFLIRVVIEDPQGNRLGAGSTRGTIGDLNNGALRFSINGFQSSAPKQW